MHTWKRLAVRLGVAGVLVIGGSLVDACATMTASVAPPGLLALNDPSGAEACTSRNNNGQGGTPGSAPQVCQGFGLSFIGPTVVLTTQIGPTTIGPAQVNSVVAGGNFAGF